MITCDDESEAIRAAAEYQAKLDRDPTLVGKFRIEVSSADPVDGMFYLRAVSLWGHGWTLPELLNIPFDKPRKRR